MRGCVRALGAISGAIRVGRDNGVNPDAVTTSPGEAVDRLYNLRRSRRITLIFPLSAAPKRISRKSCHLAALLCHIAVAQLSYSRRGFVVNNPAMMLA
jgi:hypothetical protein